MKGFSERRRAGVGEIFGGDVVGGGGIVAGVRSQETADGVVAREKSVLGTEGSPMLR